MGTGVEARRYDRRKSVVFCKTKEEFGGLSNMAPGFLLSVNGVSILTSEALYQACRFPALPDIQRLIIDQKSPMTAKMKSKPYRSQSRADWNVVRVSIMRWCLRVKLACNWTEFRDLLLATGDGPVVEESRKDDFWGAKVCGDGVLAGANVLGRLLMELREELRGISCDSLRRVDPPAVRSFLLYGEPIRAIEAAPGTAEDLFTTKSVNLTEGQARYRPMSALREVPKVGPDEIATAQGARSAATNGKSAKSYPRRLIEVNLPIREISKHARREKSIRHGHISTLHLWWARRPLAACRAIVLAALWPDPADQHCPEQFREEAATAMRAFRNRRGGTQRDWHDPEQVRAALLVFIAEFANWDNATNKDFLETALALTQVAHEALGGAPGTRPLVVDPFAGGGAIPLEALRVGADAFASDLNPVAVLLNKAVLEYIPKHRDKLRSGLEQWGQWVQERADEELAAFYPVDDDGGVPVTYIWARTIECEGPGCGYEVPLLRSLWLAKKGRRQIALRLVTGKERRRLSLELVEGPLASSVGAGTSKGGAATCPTCGFTTPVESVRAQLGKKQGGAADARLLAVVTSRPDSRGRTFRLPTPLDNEAADRAARELERRAGTPSDLPLVPDGNINHLRGFFNIVLYGIKQWGDLFTPRQALSLTTYARLVAQAPIPATTPEERDLAEAIKTFLGLLIDRVAVRCTSNCIWDATTACIMQVFNQGQSLPARWEFAEMVPHIDEGSGWPTSLQYALKVIDHGLAISNPGTCQQADATHYPLPDDSAQLFVTDPPYYAAVPYADLSDFFYSWLRRSLRGFHAELLNSDLTPKGDELVSLSHRAAMYREKSHAWFESRMGLACAEGRRITEPSGLGVVVFANKETSAWEAMLGALLDAGWIVTASWPIDTESGNRLRAKNSAALASSIHLVCRPREDSAGSLRADDVGDWRAVLRELPRRIHEWMPRLAQEGVVGADAIFACLGPALEIFSRYSRVEKADGEVVTLREYLEHVWAAVAREALSMIFEDADTAGLEEDARLTAMWLWTLSTSTNGNGGCGEVDDANERGGKPMQAAFTLEFDAARKIAQGLGAHLEDLVRVVEIKGDTARLLPVAERTHHLFGKDEVRRAAARQAKKNRQLTLFEELEAAEEEAGWGDVGLPPAGETALDRVHQAMVLFAAGRGEALKRFLVAEGIGSEARFWKLAQALSALYPKNTEEKRWVDGVLARKKGLGF